MPSAPPSGWDRSALEAPQNEHREFVADPLDRGFLLTVPARHRIGHAENGERNQPRIEIVAKLAAALSFAEHHVEDVLDAARPLADTAPALVGQELPLREEHLDEIAAVENGQNMGPDQACQLLRRRAGPAGDRLRRLEKVFHPASADDLKRGFLRAKVI